MNNVAKFFLYIFLPWVLAFVAFFTYFYLSETKKLNTNRLANEQLNVNMGARAINQKFEMIMSDLLILARHNAFYADRKLLDIKAFKTLQSDLSYFSKMKGVYDQIRFLNTEGLEIVRVNYREGEANAIAVKLLQNKGDRYYFKESMKLAQGMVYVSPLDLNKERGQIEEPHKPMIRFGTPVFNAQGDKIGVLLLNYLAGQLLDDFSSAVANIADHATLINADGYWLKHPDPSMEWGFMLNHAHNLLKMHPVGSEKIFLEEEGQYLHNAGIFTFTTIHFFQTLQLYNAQKGAREKIARDTAYQWKVISHVTPETLHAENRAILRSLVQIATPVFLLLMLLSWRLYGARMKEKEAGVLLKQQATIDTLTGLPNRQLFQDRLARAILHNKRLKTRFALFFVDLDKFKIVNDTLGHAAGDQLLQEVSARIQQVIRESDTVARLGGDEFTVILNGVNENDDIVKVAQLIIKSLGKPFTLDGQQANIGASIGIAIFPEDGVEETGLMRNADSAMYQAKQGGRNTYCFFE